MPDSVLDIEEQLRALGSQLRVQPRDDLADRVLTSIAARPAKRAGPAFSVAWQQVVAIAAAVLVMVAVLAAVSPPVRAAIRTVLRFGGIEISHALPPTLGPTPTPGPTPTLPGGHRTDLAGAAREVGFEVRVPAALGPPEVIEVADARVVSLHYHYRGSPVRIDEFAGNLGPMWEKYVVVGGVRQTSVDGHPALWFIDPVTLVYVDRHGRGHPESARRTGATLVWIDGLLTFRIDGIASLEDAVTVAATIR